MSSIFSDIRLKWDGKDYAIPPQKVGRLLQYLGNTKNPDDAVTMGRVENWSAAFDMWNIARAYAMILQFAGAEVEPEDVYEAMFTEGKDIGKTFLAAVDHLRMCFVPVTALKKMEPLTPKKKAGKKKKTKRSSSNRRSRSA